MQRSYLATGVFDEDYFIEKWREIADCQQLRASFLGNGHGQKIITLCGESAAIHEAVATFFDLPYAISIQSFARVDEPENTESEPGFYRDPDSRKLLNNLNKRTGIYSKLSSAMEYLLPVLRGEAKLQKASVSGDFGLKRAARKMDCEVYSSVNVFPIVHVFSPNGSERNVASLATRSSHIGMSATHVSDDKELTKLLCQEKGIVTPQTFRADTPGEAIRRYFASSWDSAVIKPSFGSHGEGISIDLRSYDDIIQGWHAAKAVQPHATVLIEEFIASVDLRVLVFAGRAEVAMMRVPANIIGDGESSIEELVRIKNALRLENPRLRNAPIVIDDTAQRFLKSQGLTAQSVPQVDELVLLRGNANLSSGGDSIVVTQMLDPGVLAFAENAARAFKLERYCGVDLLIRDLSKGDDGHNVSLCEINSRAEYGGVMYPMYGPAFDSPLAFLRAQLPENENKKKQMAETHDAELLAEGVSSWAGAFIALGFDIERHKRGFFVSRHGQKLYIPDVINGEVSRALCRHRHKATVSALLKEHGVSTYPGRRRFKGDETQKAEGFLSDLGGKAYFSHGRKRKLVLRRNQISFLRRKWNAEHFTLDPVPPYMRCSVTIVDGKAIAVKFGDNVMDAQESAGCVNDLSKKVVRIIPGITAAKISFFKAIHSTWSFGSISLLEPEDIHDGAILLKLASSILACGSAVSFRDADEQHGSSDNSP